MQSAEFHGNSNWDIIKINAYVYHDFEIIF